jgi:diguanylate cyclase (GGDEF)-like protein
MSLALMPHGQCFFWNIPLTTLHVSADAITACAYMSIPTMLFYNRLYNRHHASENARPLLILFAAFILSCGVGHALQAWNIWHSNYWIEGIEKALTAIISSYTAMSLYTHMPTLLGTQKALEEVDELAKQDALTGLANRRYFDQVVETAIAQVSQNQPYSLIFLDLDDFKDINGTYGHLVGDAVLQGVATLIQKTIRIGDVAARLGGNEFTILLSNCAVIDAVGVAENILQILPELPKLPEVIKACHSPILEHSTSFPTQVALPTITASIGICAIQLHITRSHLYGLADQALYRSKKEGKNQISHHP